MIIHIVHKKISYIFIILLLSFQQFALAVPGDVLFTDNFDANLSQWTVNNAGGGDASIGTETSNSGTSSLRMRWNTVSITSIPFSTVVPNAKYTVWVRRGSDAFSENPETNENLIAEYFNSSNSWSILETFPGNGTQGEIFTRSYDLPINALHANLQLRFRFTQGSGVDFDYWHIDDVMVTESGEPGLIGEWQFESLVWNGVTNEVIDSSGNNLHLTAFNAATSNLSAAIPGDPGTCFYGLFNGNVSFIQRDDDTTTADSLLDIPNTLTITTWINTNVIPTTGLKSILSKDENYEFHINTAGQIYWWWSWATLTTTGPPLTIGQWHHIAITWRSGEQLIYIDGVQRARSTQTGTLTLNNDPLQIGQDLDIAERFFDGSIDEIRIYEKVLSAARINQVMLETHPCTANGTCTKNFIDTFNSSSFSNSDGTNPWSTDWIETGDDGLPSSGNSFISGGVLRMDDFPDSGGQPRMEREFSLSGIVSATLKVRLQTSGTLETSDNFDVSVSSNGGANWTILQNYSDDFVTNTYTYDITGFASANTRIRFRIASGYDANNEFINIDNVNVFAVTNCGPDRFNIAHDGSGINCLREPFIIKAVDSGGATVTDYTGTINLSTLNNFGTWSVLDNAGTSSDLAQGTLTDSTPEDGAATYAFVAGDGGQVTLYLLHTVAETTNINVTEGAISDNNSEGNITFRPFGFMVTPSPIGTQISGRPFNATITAAGQTPTQPNCGVIEEYTGNQAISFWSGYNFPVSSPTPLIINGSTIATSEAASTPQTVNFTSGSATVAVRYDDAGQISFSAKDEIGIGDPASGNIDEVIGGVSPFVVRPFAYDVQVTGNPIALDVNAIPFATAANNFSMSLRSILWQAGDDVSPTDGIPDTGSNLSDNGVTPNISLITDTISLTPTAQLVTNSNGVLSANSVNYASFPAPTAVGAGTLTLIQNWNEVGILQINANTADFMSTGESILGSRINIGRFIPDHFNVSIDDDFSAQCSANFSYAGFANGTAGLDKNGQFELITFTVQAMNAANNPTVNYDAGFAKLENGTISRTPFNATTALAASGTLNALLLPYSFNTSGNASISLSNLNYQFNILAAPFDLRVDLDATDSDFVTGLANSNIVEQRLGRMRLIDAYGPETTDLEMRVTTDFYNGSQWTPNIADNCTNYIQTNAQLDATSYTDNLTAGDTATFSPAGSQDLINGSSALANGIWFGLPGETNYGSVVVNFDLTTQPWLSFDWDADNVTDSPSALLSFGHYRGSDRVIYWHEIRN